MDCRVYLGLTSQTNRPQQLSTYHNHEIEWCGFTRNDAYTITADRKGIIRMIHILTGYVQNEKLVTYIFFFKKISIIVRVCERVVVTHTAVTTATTLRNDSLLVFGTEEGRLGVYTIQNGSIQYEQSQSQKVRKEKSFVLCECVVN